MSRYISCLVGKHIPTQLRQGLVRTVKEFLTCLRFENATCEHQETSSKFSHSTESLSNIELGAKHQFTIYLFFFSKPGKNYFYQFIANQFQIYQQKSFIQRLFESEKISQSYLKVLSLFQTAFFAYYRSHNIQLYLLNLYFVQQAITVYSMLSIYM